MRRRDLYTKNTRIRRVCDTQASNSAIPIYGSVPRVDFNEWSDIDVLIITREGSLKKPTERLDVMHKVHEGNPLVEPVIIALTNSANSSSRRTR